MSGMMCPAAAFGGMQLEEGSEARTQRLRKEQGMPLGDPQGHTGHAKALGSFETSRERRIVVAAE